MLYTYIGLPTCSELHAGDEIQIKKKINQNSLSADHGRHFRQ